MQVNVTQKAKDSADADLHDILLEWEYGKGSDVPTLLNLTMAVPTCSHALIYPEPESSAQRGQDCLHLFRKRKGCKGFRSERHQAGKTSLAIGSGASFCAALQGAAVSPIAASQSSVELPPIEQPDGSDLGGSKTERAPNRLRIGEKPVAQVPIQQGPAQQFRQMPARHGPGVGIPICYPAMSLSNVV